MNLQLNHLFTQYDRLHEIYGYEHLTSIYGAGALNAPDVCLIFMNPTSKNVSSSKDWKGLKAPWLGTKNVWKLLSKLGIFNNVDMLNEIIRMKPEEWTNDFALKLYTEIADQSVYVTNIAKCTQSDAKHLSNSVYKEYLPLMIEELSIIKPKKIIAMGNQVNSVILRKPISVSKYRNDEYEVLSINNDLQLKVFPSYYPIGQGMRNMPLAIERIRKVLSTQTS